MFRVTGRSRLIGRTMRAFQAKRSTPPLTGAPASVVAVLGLLALASGRASAVFYDRTADVNLASSDRSISALSWVDFDGDGDADLSVMSSDGHTRLFRNDGGAFVDIASGVGLALGSPRSSNAGRWADYDRDGDLDLFVANDASADQLFRRSLAGYADLAATLRVDDDGAGVAASWVDVDGDGVIDLYLGRATESNRLYRARNAGAPFADEAADWNLADPGAPQAVAFADYDLDGDDDLFISSAHGSHRLLRCDMTHFTEVSAAAGIRAGGLGRDAVWGDYDADGDADLFQTIESGADRLYRNDAGVFAEVAATAGVDGAGPSRGAAWIDDDLDGLLDLMVIAADQLILYRNTGGRFLRIEECERLLGVGGTGRAAWGDADGDRDLDLAVATADSTLAFFINQPDIAGHDAINVELNALRAAPGGYGARVRAVWGGGQAVRFVDGGAGLGSRSAPGVHVGVGRATAIDTLEIVWPGGGRQVVTGLEAGDSIRVEESVADSLRMEVLGFLPIEDFAPHVADVWGYADAQGEYALVCKGNGLLVIDVTEPRAPTVLSEVSGTGFDLKDVKTYRHHAYAVQENGFVLVIDLTEPAAARLVAEIGDETGYHNAFIDTTRARLYLVGHRNDEALQIYDLGADPVEPPLIGRWGDYYSHDVHVRDDWALLFALQVDGFFEIVNVANPGAMWSVARFAHPDVAAHSGGFDTDRRYAFTCDEATGGHLFVWDLADSANIVPIAEYVVDEASSIHNVHLEGELAFVSYYDQGIRVVDVRDPRSPLEVGFYASTRYFKSDCSFGVYRGIWGVYPHAPSGNVVWTDMCGGGLYVGRFTGIEEPADEAPASGEPAGDGLSPPQASRAGIGDFVPNPAPGGATRFPINVPASAPVSIRVYDVHGRVVRSLWDGPLAAGSAELGWDGRDAEGRRVAAGLYFVSMRGPGIQVSRRLVVLR